MKTQKQSIKIDKKINHYNFHFNAISKKKYSVLLSKNKSKKPNYYVLETTEKILKEKFIKVGCCKCNPNLIQFNNGGNKVQVDKPWLMKIDDNYYEVYVEQEVIISNPDDQDPKAKVPSTAAVNPDYERIEDNYRSMKQEYLDGALNNSKAADVSQNKNENTYPVVAILDSGIDLRYFDNSNSILPLNYYENPCCLHVENCGCGNHDNKVYGYNFTKDEPYISHPNNPFDNDGWHKHGTRIAKIIANINENKVRIMPLKTANYEGQHQFFNIYCAFEYILAYNRAALPNDRIRIINASFSFSSENVPLIFKHYLQQFEDTNVLFITSAGNDEIKIGSGPGKYIYPAMFSRDFDLLYTITTVSEINDSFIVKENKSDQYVDYGVLADSEGKFLDPIYYKPNTYNVVDLQTSADKLKGSSYAAAIYSGYLAKQIGAGESIFNLDENNEPTIVNDVKRHGSRGNLVEEDSYA